MKIGDLGKRIGGTLAAIFFAANTVGHVDEVLEDDATVTAKTEHSIRATGNGALSILGGLIAFGFGGRKEEEQKTEEPSHNTPS